jgi:hypothetical protein
MGLNPLRYRCVSQVESSQNKTDSEAPDPRRVPEDPAPPLRDLGGVLVQFRVFRPPSFAIIFFASISRYRDPA